MSHDWIGKWVIQDTTSLSRTAVNGDVFSSYFVSELCFQPKYTFSLHQVLGTHEKISKLLVESTCLVGISLKVSGSEEINWIV